jgi:hypothetical protein
MLGGSGNRPGSICLIGALVGACGYPRPARVTGDAPGDDAPWIDSTDGPTCVTSPPSTRARWRGDGNLNDDTGSYDASVGSGAISYVAGKHGQAFKLNGSTVLIADANDQLWQSGSFSLELWVKTGATTGVLVDKYDKGGVDTGANNSDYQLRLDTSGSGTPTFEVRGATGNFCIFGAPNVINDNAWHHLVGVRDLPGAQCLLYVDGQFAASEPRPGQDLSTSNGDSKSDPVTMGGAQATGAAGYNSNSYLNGYLDEVAYYDDALSAEEIAAIYAAPDGICPYP